MNPSEQDERKVAYFPWKSALRTGCRLIAAGLGLWPRYPSLGCRLDLVHQVLGPRREFDRKDIFCCEGVLNMTFLALNLSHFVNGVAKKHGEVARLMFARYRIDSITNGVHAATLNISRQKQM